MSHVLLLLCGLPGAGKTTLANQICHVRPDIEHINADAVRAAANDWDFTAAGRLRQTKRMREAALDCFAPCALVDQVCPTPELRALLNPHYTIWLNTITPQASRYYDTSQLWIDPTEEERAQPGFLELDKWVPNDSIFNLMNTFCPAYKTSNGRLAWEYNQRQQELLNNPEGLEAL